MAQMQRLRTFKRRRFLTFVSSPSLFLIYRLSEFEYSKRLSVFFSSKLQTASMRFAVILSVIGLAVFANAAALPNPDPVACAPLPVDDDGESPCHVARAAVVKRIAQECDGGKGSVSGPKG